MPASAASARTLLCPALDYGRTAGSAQLGRVRVVTWAISRKPLRPGALVTAGDVCHLHSDRASAERGGALMGGDPDLVKLEKHTARVYRVLWSLSDMAGGELRKPAPPARTTSSEGTQPRSELAGEPPDRRPRGRHAPPGSA